MRNIALILSYDGSEFFGWQKQEGVPTVQGTIEEVIKRIFNEEVDLIGASRTDRGAHALYQVANFLTRSTLDTENLAKAISAHLPHSIVIRKAIQVSTHFNARFSAKKKTYMYIVDNSYHQNPILEKKIFHFPYKLDYEKILSSKDVFIGEKDFKALENTAFRKQNTQYSEKIRNTVRTIYEVRIEKKNSLIIFYVSANGFLYKMVRNLVGTLLEIGRGKKTIEAIKEGLEKKDRKKLGFCVPPYALYLYSVEY